MAGIFGILFALIFSANGIFCENEKNSTKIFENLKKNEGKNSIEKNFLDFLLDVIRNLTPDNVVRASVELTNTEFRTSKEFGDKKFWTPNDLKNKEKKFWILNEFENKNFSRKIP